MFQIFSNLDIWEMRDLRIAEFEKRRIWESQILRNAEFEKRRIWEINELYDVTILIENGTISMKVGTIAREKTEDEEEEGQFNHIGKLT